MGSRYSLSFEEFLELTPKQIDLMQTACLNGLAVESYNQQVLHGRTKVSKPRKVDPYYEEKTPEITQEEKETFIKQCDNILSSMKSKRVH